MPEDLLEGTPEEQVADWKSWMTERRQTVEISDGKMLVTFPRRSIAIVQVPRPPP